MPTTFAGYSPKAITWLRQIGKHNERSWFQANKAAFETHVQDATRRLVVALDARLARFAPEHRADPARALTRIHRDLRFGRDKSPYKTYLGARFPYRGRRNEECAGFWVSVSARGVDVVGGTVWPGTPQQRRIRAHLAERHPAFARLVRRKPLRDAMGTLQGEKLKRVPRGYAADHPAAELLKHKQLYFSTRLSVRTATSGDLVPEIARRFRLMAPFVAFLDEALA